MSAQVIFSVLDFLNIWVQKAQQIRSKLQEGTYNSKQLINSVLLDSCTLLHFAIQYPIAILIVSFVQNCTKKKTRKEWINF